jgi:hypothetical protein
MEDSSANKLGFHPIYNITKIQHFRVANTWGLNVHMKNSTKCETVARIQDTQAAELWNNVAKCDG